MVNTIFSFQRINFSNFWIILYSFCSIYNSWWASCRCYKL